MATDRAMGQAELDAEIKKRLCCPPLQAEVDLYGGLFDEGILTTKQKVAYNAMVDGVLKYLAEGRARILAGRYSRPLADIGRGEPGED